MPGPALHHRLTAQWAVEEGMSRAEAAVVANADIMVDMIWPGSKKWGRHFNPMATLIFAPMYFRAAMRTAAAGEYRAESLVALGRALHCRQDGIGHGVLGLAHLKARLGVLKRNPDDWEQMPPKKRAAIESATRRILRRYIDATR